MGSAMWNVPRMGVLTSAHKNCPFVKDKSRPCKNPILGLLVHRKKKTCRKLYTAEIFPWKDRSVKRKYSRAALLELQGSDLASHQVT